MSDMMITAVNFCTYVSLHNRIFMLIKNDAASMNMLRRKAKDTRCQLVVVSDFLILLQVWFTCTKRSPESDYSTFTLSIQWTHAALLHWAQVSFLALQIAFVYSFVRERKNATCTFEDYVHTNLHTTWRIMHAIDAQMRRGLQLVASWKTSHTWLS